MIRILNIETSTDICSVSISENGIVADQIVSQNDRSHSRVLGTYIEKILTDNRLEADDFNALAISSGPGSYTGLRIGTSTAKAFCFAAEIPLIAVNTMKIMAKMLVEKQNPKNEKILIVPMIDAKRAEVYTAVFDLNLNIIKDTKALILEENSFAEYKDYKLILCGNGAEKAKNILNNNNNIHYVEDVFPSAEFMGHFSTDLYNKNQFVDVVYFEPFYLKDFVATTPKNKVLNLKK